MEAFNQIKEAVCQFLSIRYGVELSSEKVSIDHTRKEFEGDYTIVVFPFVKMMKTSPENAGEAIGKYLTQELAFVKSYNTIKGFLNLSFTEEFWVSQVETLINDEQWFLPKSGDSQILVEFSSPNTNKPLHLGHLRNNFLGHSVSLMKSFAGHDVIKTQIINDRGIHICKSMLAWQRFGENETPESSGLKGDKLVGKYYVKFDQELKREISGLVDTGLSEEEAEKASTLMHDVREMLVKWEQGDKEVISLWQMMNGWVYEGFETTYKDMGVSFDKLYYESDTFSKGKSIVMKGVENGIFYQREDKSVWCNLKPDGLDEKLLIRGDGTTVYMTQDIGTAVQRFEDYPAMTQAIYTVGDEQDYHFKVLFKILEKLGYEWASHCKHLSYGMVDLPSGKMKSREGTVVDADDLIADVTEAAKLSSEEKGKLEGLSTEQRQELFEMLGLGALRFFLLRVDPKKRMLFDPVESVSLNGDTGPFIQYTHARCKAVLRKAGPIALDSNAGVGEKERLLARTLLSFRDEMIDAADAMNPAAIANYCLDLAKTYNQFYQSESILNAADADRGFRIALTRVTANTISAAMALLGIRVPEQM